MVRSGARQAGSRGRGRLTRRGAETSFRPFPARSLAAPVRPATGVSARPCVRARARACTMRAVPVSPARRSTAAAVLAAARAFGSHDQPPDDIDLQSVAWPPRPVLRTRFTRTTRRPLSGWPSAQTREPFFGLNALRTAVTRRRRSDRFRPESSLSSGVPRGRVMVGPIGIKPTFSNRAWKNVDINSDYD